MDLQNELIDYTDRARALRELLDSDVILELSHKEIAILENMQEGLVVYCKLLRLKVSKEASIIKLKDER